LTTKNHPKNVIFLFNFNILFSKNMLADASKVHDIPLPPVEAVFAVGKREENTYFPGEGGFAKRKLLCALCPQTAS